MKINSELKIFIIYLVMGVVWITFSDRILYALIRSPELHPLVQTYKGWFYVIITGFIFYIILHTTMEKMRKQSNKLEESYSQLEADNEEFIALNEEVILKNKELHKQEKKLRKIINLVPHLIFAKDEDGRFLIVNQAVARLYNKTPVEIIKKSHSQLHSNISTDELNLFSESDKKVIKENKEIILEEESITDYKGEKRIFKTQKIPFGFSNSKKKAVLGVAVDITELKRKEKLIEEYHYKETCFREEIILSITNMLEIHDAYTQGHSSNVANLAREIAAEMSLSQEEIDYAFWTGIVHDIGKILIPTDILNKNGKLTDSEYDVIKKHPEWGYKTLTKSQSLKEIAEFVLYHHERWDGKGYPEGIKGNDIPLISQIITVADTWDAMRTDRPYRRALDFDIALNEIKQYRELQFAPDVVDAFLDIV